MGGEGGGRGYSAWGARKSSGAVRNDRRGAGDELCSRRARRAREGGGDGREEKLPVLAKDKGDAHGWRSSPRRPTCGIAGGCQFAGMGAHRGEQEITVIVLTDFDSRLTN